MVRLIDMVTLADTFLIGDAATNQILSPERVSDDNVIYATVASITAQEDTPVFWLNL